VQVPAPPFGGALMTTTPNTRVWVLALSLKDSLVLAPLTRV
jgi:hypothetical protein